MPRLPIRILAIALLLGQLVQVSGGAWCGGQLRDPAGQCDESMAQPAGVSITSPTDGLAAEGCNLLGPCGAPVPALTSAPVVNRFVLGDTRVVVATIPKHPESFHPVPIPPPPQA